MKYEYMIPICVRPIHKKSLSVCVLVSLSCNRLSLSLSYSSFCHAHHYDTSLQSNVIQIRIQGIRISASTVLQFKNRILGHEISVSGPPKMRSVSDSYKHNSNEKYQRKKNKQVIPISSANFGVGVGPPVLGILLLFRCACGSHQAFLPIQPSSASPLAVVNAPVANMFR